MTTATEDRKLTAKDFQVSQPNDWCPGCGDFGMLSAVQQAFARLGLEAHKIAVVATGGPAGPPRRVCGRIPRANRRLCRIGENKD